MSWPHCMHILSRTVFASRIHLVVIYLFSSPSLSCQYSLVFFKSMNKYPCKTSILYLLKSTQHLADRNFKLLCLCRCGGDCMSEKRSAWEANECVKGENEQRMKRTNELKKNWNEQEICVNSSIHLISRNVNILIINVFPVFLDSMILVRDSIFCHNHTTLWCMHTEVQQQKKKSLYIN